MATLLSLVMGYLVKRTSLRRVYYLANTPENAAQDFWILSPH